MRQTTNITGIITGYPVLTNNAETDSIMISLFPLDGAMNHRTGILCKGELAMTILCYFRNNTVIEVNGCPRKIENKEFPGDIPESVIEASSIKFLYIKQKREQLAI